MNGVCTHCESTNVIVYNGVELCPMHYRVQQMRTNAAAKGKIRPPRASVLELVYELQEHNMICQPCGRTMNWLKSDGASTVVTLQHDRSGGFRLICARCNAQHRLHPGDSFYDMPQGVKRCPGCGINKRLGDFHRDSKTVSGRQTYCIGCKRKHRKAVSA